MAREIGFALLCMDEIKERLADAIGPEAANMNDELGRASVHQIIAIAAEMLRSGQSVVIEGFFQSDLYSSDLSTITPLANAVLVHIRADDAVLKKRYEARALEDERHWVHGDREKLGTLKPQLPAYMAEPLHLDIPVITLDTSREALDITGLARRIMDVLHPKPMQFPA